AFTYQGLLTDQGAPANGHYDLRFTLYDAPILGNVVGITSTFDDLAVSNGLFTVSLSPGANVFDGHARWLEIAVRPGASSGNYTNVGARQQLTASPYAVYALKAAMLDGPLPGNQLTGTYSNAVDFNNTSNYFSGNGAGLTTLNASQLRSGIIPDARLSPNVALLDANQTFTGTPNFNASVGIGTTTALHPLTVGAPETPVNLPSMAGFYRSGGAYLTARDTASHAEALLGADATAIVAAMSDHPLVFRAGNGTGFGNTEYMRIERGGNV